MNKFFCKIGLHWPLHMKTRAFRDSVTGKQVALRHCNCGRFWLSTGRYSFFKIETDCPQAWFTAIKESEKL